MEGVRRLGRHIWPRRPSQPRFISNLAFTKLDPTVKIEEERMPAYDLGLFYPVRIGEVFKDRYQVLSKLGFGANSTVWLCRDLRKHNYAALKVYVHSSRASREGDILRHLASVKSTHLGRTNVRTLLDTFKVNSCAGSHQCLVHEPFLTSMLHFQASFPDKTLVEALLKAALERIFYALDYLHSDAHVVHTDIQAKNIMIAARDESVFKEWDEVEAEEPTPRKISEDGGSNIIYRSRDFFQRKGMRSVGLPILCDFGEARVGLEHEGLIQPEIYRAPEVILGMKWTEKVDIWNVGVMIWNLFEGRHMFRGLDEEKQYSEAHMLAEMTALLGPPPPNFLKRNEKSLEFWDESGNWRDQTEESEGILEGENKELFMKFMRKMLRWVPEERASAAELLEDEWMITPCK
ncbi:hypothetical protein FQN54_000686 [Arachnomyces sp. PD_36]|nr:hypothetical protein FQN54_000686 [Arachnomyces sp. PD_36]